MAFFISQIHGQAAAPLHNHGAPPPSPPIEPKAPSSGSTSPTTPCWRATKTPASHQQPTISPYRNSTKHNHRPSRAQRHIAATGETQQYYNKKQHQKSSFWEQKPILQHHFSLKQPTVLQKSHRTKLQYFNKIQEEIKKILKKILSIEINVVLLHSHLRRRVL